MNCEVCDKVFHGKNLFYENDKVVAVLSDAPAATGHVLVLPRDHYPIIEKIPDNVFAEMFRVANKISAACFKTAGAEGTNIVINNGIAAGQKTNHASINIIPRLQHDGLHLQWDAIKAKEDELQTDQLMIKEALGKLTDKKPKKEVIEKIEEEIEEIPEEENYLLKQLDRTP